jgi:L-lactate dehydrogenase
MTSLTAGTKSGHGSTIRSTSSNKSSYYSTSSVLRMNRAVGDGDGSGENDNIAARKNLFDTHFEKLRMSHSVEPIPYSNDLELTPKNTVHTLGHKKVTIVGCGQVGMATAYAFLNQATAGTIALIDMNREKLVGEAKDLEQGSAFHQHIRILASDEYSVSANSHLVVVTAGAAQQPGESRLNLLERNVSIMKNVIPKVLAFSPSASICIVANPCDIMTAVASKIAGPSVPAGRIFGSGTCLDSSRLRSMLAKRLELDTSAIQGYILGEHGDSSVPIWSSVNVGGVPLVPSGQDPDDVHDQMHKAVVNSAYDVIERKGSTNWAIGLTCGTYPIHLIIPINCMSLL